MEWSAVIEIDSTDVSAQLMGRISVDAEESTARVAQFTLKPASGSIDVADWIGADVTIDYVADPNGSPVTTRIFTGVVNLPTYDPVTGLTQFDCTDNLQGHFEAKTEAQILTAIPGGVFSAPIFGEREDGWQQAMDVLSTVQKGYDLNKDGTTAALTDWEAKVTPDYTYAQSDVVDGSVKLELVRLRDLINKVVISFECRFSRLHHRNHSYGWAGYVSPYSSFDFCTYYGDSYELPTRDMIQAAAGGAGWAIKNDSIDFETLPVTGSYYCGGTVVWSISEELLNQLVTSADWIAVRRWAQTITETYTLTIQEAGSITKFGEFLQEDGAGYQAEYDDAQWDNSSNTDVPDGWSQNAINDYTEDQTDRTESDNALLTLMQVAKTIILSSHRQNYLTVDVSIEPTIERSHTASIDAGNVTGKSKVFQYTHNLNIDNGSAITSIKIAISKTGAGGSSDSLTVPAPPDTEPTHAAPSSSTNLPNRIGNDDTAPDFDEDWTGFTGNYTVAQGSPTDDQIYPRRFRLEAADIEDESRQEAEAEKLQTYNVQAPNETLTING